MTSLHCMTCIFFVSDFVLTEQQRKEMTLEEQLKDLQEKLDMTQAIKHGGTVHVFYNHLKQIVPSERTAEKFLFEWSHYSIGFYSLAQKLEPPCI